MKHRATPQGRAGYSAPTTATVAAATTTIAGVSAPSQAFTSELDVLERHRDAAFAALPDAERSAVCAIMYGWQPSAFFIPNPTYAQFRKRNEILGECGRRATEAYQRRWDAMREWERMGLRSAPGVRGMVGLTVVNAATDRPLAGARFLQSRSANFWEGSPRGYVEIPRAVEEVYLVGYPDTYEPVTVFLRNVAGDETTIRVTPKRGLSVFPAPTTTVTVSPIPPVSPSPSVPPATTVAPAPAPPASQAPTNPVAPAPMVPPPATRSVVPSTEAPTAPPATPPAAPPALPTTPTPQAPVDPTIVFPANGQPVIEGALADDGIILHGYVRESKDSSPLAKATVTLLGSNRRSFRAYADDRGYYQFRESYFPDGIPSGAYTLSAYPSSDAADARVMESDVRDGFTIDATKRQRFDFILKNETATTPMPHARYYGRVTDGRTGAPLRGAAVKLYKRGSSATEQAITNTVGFYQFSWTRLQDDFPRPEDVEFFYVVYVPANVKGGTRGPEFFSPKDRTRREYNFELSHP